MEGLFVDGLIVFYFDVDTGDTYFQRYDVIPTPKGSQDGLCLVHRILFKKKDGTCAILKVLCLVRV